VYVTSTDPAGFDPDALKQPEDPERPLPRKKTQLYDFPTHPYGDENVKPRAGYLTLAAAQEIIVQYKDDPVANSARALAEQHGLDENLVRDMLTHFKVFTLHRAESQASAERRNDPLVAQPDWEEDKPERLNLPAGPPQPAKR